MAELTASGDADQVEARLRETLDALGLQLFARIDHATGARKALQVRGKNGTTLGRRIFGRSSQNMKKGLLCRPFLSSGGGI